MFGKSGGRNETVDKLLLKYRILTIHMYDEEINVASNNILQFQNIRNIFI